MGAWGGECGAANDREINGAANLCRYALDRTSWPRINAWGEEGSGVGLEDQRETGLATGINCVLSVPGLSNGTCVAARCFAA
jgi:hypothetical protein